MIRLLAVLGVVGWYICVRSIIFYYFLGGSANKDFFDWWWSWFIAFPITIGTVAGAVLIFTIVIPWVIEGFREQNDAD